MSYYWMKIEKEDTRAFSTTCGKALRGIGSAFLRFLTLLHIPLNIVQLTTATQSYRGADAEGAAAASAAALARPCRASMGALRVDLGNVSSDSSSYEGAVLGTIPYVAYLFG